MELPIVSLGKNEYAKICAFMLLLTDAPYGFCIDTVIFL